MLSLDDLRPYQRESISAIGNNWMAGMDTLVAAPTGAGKTHIIGGLHYALRKRARYRSLVLVHRNGLVDQVVERLQLFGLDVGTSELNDIYVSTVQSLYDKPPSIRDLVVVDEAHRSVADEYMPIVARQKRNGAKLAGFTATPQRLDGRDPVPGLFERGYIAITAADLIQRGWLVPPVFIDEPLHESTVHGYIGKEGDIRNTPKTNMTILATWMRHASGRPTAMFVRTIAQAQALARLANRNGFSAAIVSGTRSQGAITNDEAKRGLENGRYDIVLNAMKWIEGIDVPCISAVVMARRTSSSLLFTQAVGRGLRPSPGKRNCIVLCLSDRPEYYDLAEWSSTYGVTPA